MSRLRHLRCADFLRRLFAAGCAALIFALGLFAASPTLHDRLHHHAPAPFADDGCAIVLFAGGVTASLTVAARPPPPAEWREQPFVSLTEIILDSPAYLWQPERGPPNFRAA